MEDKASGCSTTEKKCKVIWIWGHRSTLLPRLIPDGETLYVTSWIMHWKQPMMSFIDADNVYIVLSYEKGDFRSDPDFCRLLRLFTENGRTKQVIVDCDFHYRCFTDRSDPFGKVTQPLEELVTTSLNDDMTFGYEAPTDTKKT